MDDDMQASIGAELEVGRRLDDYARARLTPGDAAKARSRARVMREARLAFAGQAAAAIARRGVALLLAATLSLGVVGGALAASTAGGPLYGTRIWLEDVTLPSEPAARAAAELTRLESRIAEIEAAVRAGNRGAAEAALAAYQQISDEAVADANASGDQAAIDRLAAALDRHVDNLTRVAGQVPPQAAEAIHRNIQRAILHNDAAIERMESRGTPPNGSGGQGSPGGPAANPTATGEPAAQPEPAEQPEPAATPKPTKAPTPTKPPKPPTPTDPPAIPPDEPPAGPPYEPANQPGGQGNPQP
jgi:hypothetical protein